jgi:hypothetical protein
MQSGGSFAERPWDFSLFACTGGSLARGDPACRLQSALALKSRARKVLSSRCSQHPVIPGMNAVGMKTATRTSAVSSVCKKLINTRCGSRTVADPGASVRRSGQAMPHFVILRQLLNRVILARATALWKMAPERRALKVRVHYSS